MSRLKFAKVLSVGVLVALFTLLSSCAVTRKLDAAMILRNTQVEFSELRLESVNLNPSLFEKAGDAIKSSLLPNPQVVSIVQNLARGIIEADLGHANLSAVLVATSKDEDSLWVRHFAATLSLDTLIDLPLMLKDSCVLAPGENTFTLSTQFPLDNRLFKLRDLRKFRVKGVIEVALDFDGPKVPLQFDIERQIKPEEIKALEDRARETLLNNLVSDWVGALGL